MGTSGIDKRELLRMLIRAIEEDEELRYTLMGLLGFKEILDRITRLEERFARLEERQQALEERFAELEKRFAELAERQQRLEERFAELEERFAQLEERMTRLEERVARLEERVTRLEERFAELEERFIRLEERVARLEERFAQLEERFLKLEERVTRLEERVARLERAVITIANRFGVLSDHVFREAIKGIVEEVFGAQAYRWSTYDEEGIVYGHPAQVEVDVVVKDGVHLLVEVKSRADTGDLLELARIAELYKRKEGVEPRLAIVAGFVSPRARKLAPKLGVRIYSYLEEEFSGITTL